MRKRLFYLFDLIVVALSPFIAVALRNNFTPTSQQLLDILPFAVLGVCIAAIVFLVVGTHRGIWRYVSLPDFSRIMVAAAVTLFIALFATFSFNRLDGIARSVPLIQWALIVAGMISARIVARALFARKSVRSDEGAVASGEHVLVVGLNRVAELYLRCVASLAADKISVAGLLDESLVMKGRRLHECEVLGQPSELSQIMALLNIHGVNVKRVVITTPFQDLSQASRDELLRLERSNVIKLDLFEERLGFAGVVDGDNGEKGRDDDLGCFAEEFLDDGHLKFRSRGFCLAKSAFDKLGALLFMVGLLPVTLVVSLLVALDVGLPLTFWQERSGRKGHPFRVYKFRTMKSAHDEAGNRIPDELRQSKFGRLLRRLRVDELPQLFNVLAGEMSLVGPRPLLPVDLPKGRPDILEIRNSVCPGLTGWAQVNGGKEVSVDDKVVLDLWYIKNQSLSLDFKILLRTIDMVIWGERLNKEAVELAYKDLGLVQGEPLHVEKKEPVGVELGNVDNAVVLHGSRKIA